MLAQSAHFSLLPSSQAQPFKDVIFTLSGLRTFTFCFKTIIRRVIPVFCPTFNWTQCSQPVFVKLLLSNFIMIISSDTMETVFIDFFHVQKNIYLLPLYTLCLLWSIKSLTYTFFRKLYRLYFLLVLTIVGNYKTKLTVLP